VVRGDTLSEIAASYGMKTKALWNLNRNQVTNPDKIYPGQILKLR
jgi:LysM repeat protein